MEVDSIVELKSSSPVKAMKVENVGGMTFYRPVMQK